MAYDRYDTRTRRENRNEERRPRSLGRSYGREGYRDLDYDRSDRDFFERASDEVRSWFGDDRAGRRRELDERYDERGQWGQRPRFENEGYRRPYTGRRYERTPFETSEFDRSDRYDFDRGYTQNRFDRGQTQAEYTGFDRDYSNWRNRQIDELDRDYDEWRTENARRFDDEFSNWRSERMSKREMMRTIPEHAEVVDCDGTHVGTIDKIVGDRMILTKKDSDDGHHHSLNCRHLDRVEGNKVMLNLTADKAQNEWRDEDTRRALGERMDQGQDGPHMLNRSFADTY
ncbi:DUF2171 domain-containing protein [Sphingomicrobium nitratireducens]|uniref:DUF2171 domain-containing protein n=1 Tax=Sphingomicrobium nitratireducens TaxID=2964666 RepID=UPI0022409B12|nr:DUF2171 domain-containing protein [Sphingomicrobium nitratireducens]